MRMENVNRERLNVISCCQATELAQGAEVLFNTADDKILCLFDMYYYGD